MNYLNYFRFNRGFTKLSSYRCGNTTNSSNTSNSCGLRCLSRTPKETEKGPRPLRKCSRRWRRGRGCFIQFKKYLTSQSQNCLHWEGVYRSALTSLPSTKWWFEIPPTAQSNSLLFKWIYAFVDLRSSGVRSHPAHSWRPPLFHMSVRSSTGNSGVDVVSTNETTYTSS